MMIVIIFKKVKLVTSYPLESTSLFQMNVIVFLRIVYRSDIELYFWSNNSIFKLSLTLTREHFQLSHRF
jgi:hypothetical protein